MVYSFGVSTMIFLFAEDSRHYLTCVVPFIMHDTCQAPVVDLVLPCRVSREWH